jgi:hypothetical protein
MPRLGVPLLLSTLAFAAFSARPVYAADSPDPLQYVPGSATLVLKIEDPRKLAETITGLDAVKDGYSLASGRELLNSTVARRVFQMLGYLERVLGAKWPTLLDQIAGGGIAVAGQIGSDQAPALLILQGTDEKMVSRAFDLMIQVVGDELARLGVPNQPRRETEHGAETVMFGEGLHAARRGAVILVSNQAKGLEAALTMRPDDGVLAKKSIRDAKSLLPKGPLAWLWFDFATVKQSKQAKDFFEATRKDFLQTVVVGSTIDCLRRSEFITAGLYREPTGFRLAVRLPAGRSEFPPEFALHVPPGSKPGSRPLLEPPGVLYSQSFYLDVGYFWKNRDKLVNDEMRKQFEEGEKGLSKVLPGSVKFGELLEMWGPYHRLVVVNHDTPPYKTQPTLQLPGFGYAVTMTDPKFGTAVAAALRSGGLLASIQFGIKQSEIDHDSVKIVAYRFPENKPYPDDPNGVRFNFEPCFAVVGDQFLAASTVEVCKKLIAEVKRTADLPGSAAVWRAKAFAAGGGDALIALPDPLVTDAILGEGVGIEEARKRVDALAGWLKTLGTIRLEIDEATAEYRLDLVWESKK